MPRTVVPPVRFRSPNAGPVGGDGLPERLAEALAQLVDAGVLGLEAR